MAAPTFVSFGASVFNTTTTPKTISITTTTGDRIVVMAFAESASQPTTTAPTGNSNTFTQAQSIPPSSSNAVSRAIAWTATEASGATYNVSVPRPSSDGVLWWGAMVWVWRDSDGFGASAAPTAGSTSNSVPITTTQANSGLCVGSADWNAADGTSRTRRTINSSTGAEDNYFRDSSHYSTYGQHYTDCGSVGSVTGGYSAPASQASAIIAVEVKGTAGGGGPALPPILIMQTRRAY